MEITKYDRKIIRIIVQCLFIVFFLSCSTDVKEVNYDQDNETGWFYAEKIISSISIPEFHKRSYNIIEYGATGDGITDCTEAFRKAIEKCNHEDGGTVIVPEGTFLTGAIHLLSNVRLQLDKGSVIRFSTDFSKYLPVVHTRFEGMECLNYSPFIYAYQQENIAISGDGTLDGQGQAWWKWKGPWEGQLDIGWKKGMPNQLKSNTQLLEMVEKNIPLAERVFGEGHFLRPNFIQFYQCKKILIEGITIINSPMWVIHPVLSENMTVRNVKIESLGPNNDGCNPESSKNILIKNCFFNNGDDCIAIKSGRNNDGRKLNIPSENIIVQDCKMKEGHGGIVIGSEVSGNVKNVYAENCIMDSPHLDRALRIKSNSVRGGSIENIYFRNSEVRQVKEAVILIDMFYDNDRSDFIPTVKNINIENIVSFKSKYAIWIKAYKDKPVDGLYIAGCKFNNVENGDFIENVVNVNIKNTNYSSLEIPEN